MFNLELLYLFDNQLSGEIPEFVCNLIVSNNLNIDDIISGNSSLINNCEILVLNCGMNAMMLLEHIYWIYQTQGLSGEIPSEIGSLTNLRELYLLDNQLSGKFHQR